MATAWSDMRPVTVVHPPSGEPDAEEKRPTAARVPRVVVRRVPPPPPAVEFPADRRPRLVVVWEGPAIEGAGHRPHQGHQQPLEAGRGRFILITHPFQLAKEVLRGPKELDPSRPGPYQSTPEWPRRQGELAPGLREVRTLERGHDERDARGAPALPCPLFVTSQR